MLQPAEKQRIRLLLGFPSEFRFASTRLEGILTTVDDEGIDQIRAILTKITVVDEAIALSGISGAGALKQVDEIHFYGSNSSLTLSALQRKEGRILIGRLSIILGVPPYSDYYGTAGYLGDSFSGLGGYGNGSRHYPLG